MWRRRYRRFAKLVTDFSLIFLTGYCEKERQLILWWRVRDRAETNRLNIIVWLKINATAGQQQAARIHDQRIYFLDRIIANDLLVNIVQPQWIEFQSIVSGKYNCCNL